MIRQVTEHSPSLWTPTPYPEPRPDSQVASWRNPPPVMPDPRGSSPRGSYPQHGTSIGPRLELFRKPANERSGAYNRASSDLNEGRRTPKVKVSEGHAQFIKSMSEVLERSYKAREALEGAATAGKVMAESGRVAAQGRASSGMRMRAQSAGPASYSCRIGVGMQGSMITLPKPPHN